MPNAFSLDLRERVWRAYDQGKLSQPKVAEQFGVSASFMRLIFLRKRGLGFVGVSCLS
jgi:transposase